PHLPSSPTRRSSDLNAATQRWCDKNGAVPAWLDGLNKAFGFTRKIAPFKPDAARGQRADIPFFTNAVVPEHLSAELVESCPLYRSEEHTSELQSREN